MFEAKTIVYMRIFRFGLAEYFEWHIFEEFPQTKAEITRYDADCVTKAYVR